MHNFTRFQSHLAIVSIVLLALATGCGTQPPHPNQLNSFDGASYDTLTLAHGALLSLRTQVSTSYPKYSPVFNQAAQSYAVAYNAYALYRTSPSDQAAVNLAVTNLTVSIVALEEAVQNDLQISPSVVIATRKQAKSLRQRAAGQNLTVSDLLTELEIAAAVARAVPATSVYARLASMVIEATSEALAAEAASAGQPIDLSTIQPMATL